jgi:hypothetical protein
MTKSILLFVLTVSAASAQLFSYGIKGGLPMTSFIDAVQSGSATSSSTTNRYIVGPTGEVHLPHGFGVEVDILYRHFNFQWSGPLVPNPFAGASTYSTATTGSAWEFPVLGKYRIKSKVVHPFVDAGVSWDALSGLTQTATQVLNSVTSKTSTSNPTALSNSTTRGFVMGGGLDVKVLIFHISPEVRFTRWGDKHFIDPSGLIHSNLSQAEFLVGFTF